MNPEFQIACQSAEEFSTYVLAQLCCSALLYGEQEQFPDVFNSWTYHLKNVDPERRKAMVREMLDQYARLHEIEAPDWSAVAAQMEVADAPQADD